MVTPSLYKKLIGNSVAVYGIITHIKWVLNFEQNTNFCSVLDQKF